MLYSSPHWTNLDISLSIFSIVIFKTIKIQMGNELRFININRKLLIISFFFFSRNTIKWFLKKVFFHFHLSSKSIFTRMQLNKERSWFPAKNVEHYRVGCIDQTCRYMIECNDKYMCVSHRFGRWRFRKIQDNDEKEHTNSKKKMYMLFNIKKTSTLHVETTLRWHRQKSNKCTPTEWKRDDNTYDDSHFRLSLFGILQLFTDTIDRKILFVIWAGLTLRDQRKNSRQQQSKCR